MQEPYKRNRSPLVKGLTWLAFVIAFMAALLGAPSVNELTRDVVIEVARASYSPGMTRFIAWLWMVACFPLAFLTAFVGLYITMTLFVMTLRTRR